VKILLSYQKFISKVNTVSITICCTKKVILLGAGYLIRLFSRSNNGIKFLPVIKIVSNGEINFFFGHKNEAISSEKIIIVEVQ
jgi:hypothetical protein